MPENGGHIAVVGAKAKALRRALELTQQQVAAAAASSIAVVSRLERGERLPDRTTIRRLDQALEAEGKLEALWLASLELPPAATAPARRWVHNYPAAYWGLIWMRIRSDPAVASPTLAFEIRWGPWTLTRRLRWPAHREVALWHTKGDDGLSIPVIVRTDQPVEVEFHIGEPPTEAIDINPGWVNDGR